MNKADKNYYESIKNYLDDCHFDIAPNPLSGKVIFDEAHLAKLITRIVVSAATVATTTLSLRQYIKDIISHRKG
jgi:hypothetical protein